MAHTEGPWIACRPGDSEWSKDYWEIEDPYGHTATVYGDDAEAAHNAHLIAAAPELLAACVAAVSAITYLLSNDDDDPNYADTLNTLATAIAKAEGRTDDQ